ncbi:hypothetical protein CR513_53289, partial [Mucuna pruriens]
NKPTEQSKKTASQQQQSEQTKKTSSKCRPRPSNSNRVQKQQQQQSTAETETATKCSRNRNNNRVQQKQKLCTQSPTRSSKTKTEEQKRHEQKQKNRRTRSGTPLSSAQQKQSMNEGGDKETVLQRRGQHGTIQRRKIGVSHNQKCYSLRFYKGVIHSFDPAKKKHKVSYDDGDKEILNLMKEKWKVIEADSDADGEEGSDRASLDASTDMPPKKKGKTSGGESTKQGKMDASSRSGGAAASSRSKGVSTKSNHKSKDGNKSKDSKTISKSKDEDSRKFKDGTPKSGGSKSIVAAKKMSNKSKNSDTSKTSESKDDETCTPKPSAKSKQETTKGGKSKQETPKTAISKGKAVKSGGKTDANGTGKVKSGLLKRKESENENSDVSAGEVEDAKGKTSKFIKGTRNIIDVVEAIKVGDTKWSMIFVRIFYI